MIVFMLYQKSDDPYEPDTEYGIFSTKEKCWDYVLKFCERRNKEHGFYDYTVTEKANHFVVKGIYPEKFMTKKRKHTMKFHWAEIEIDKPFIPMG